MTEIEIRAGEELERRMDRFARVRLDPSAAQAKRARAAVMEAAWRQRLEAPGVTPAGSVRPEGQTATALWQTRRHGPFSGWGPRRLTAPGVAPWPRAAWSSESGIRARPASVPPAAMIAKRST